VNSRRVSWCVALLAFVWQGCAAPIVPTRSKPGGSARWAEAIATAEAYNWQTDATLCRITGAGIGADGWLPDRGGQWALAFWSANSKDMFEVTIDSDGNARGGTIPAIPQRGSRLPSDWLDSPKVWAATRSHQKQDAVHTLDAELSAGAAPEHPGDVVWRIRFWLPDNSFEIHDVSASGRWLEMH